MTRAFLLLDYNYFTYIALKLHITESINCILLLFGSKTYSFICYASEVWNVEGLS